MRHDEARTLLAPWALDLLDPEVREPVADHIEVCGICQMEAALYDEAASGLLAYAAKQPGALAVAALPAFDDARLETLKFNVRRALKEKDGLLPRLPEPAAAPAVVAAPVTTGNGVATVAERAPTEASPPARPEARSRGRWGFRGRHSPPEPVPGPSGPPADDDDFGTDLLDLDALTRRPDAAPEPWEVAEAPEAEARGVPDEAASVAAADMAEPLSLSEPGPAVEPEPAVDAGGEDDMPADKPVLRGELEVPAPLAEAAGVVLPPAGPAPAGPPGQAPEHDALESLLDLIAPREAPPRPAPPAVAAPAPPRPAPPVPAAEAPGTESRPAAATPTAAAGAALATPPGPRRRLPQPWEVFEDEFAAEEDDEFSTEAALEELFGGAPRAAPARAATAVARASAETTYIDEYGDPYILRKGVNSGWRSASILLGLLTIGLFAGMVAGFFVLLDTRNRADLLEQKQPRLALYFGFANDEVQGTIYLQPPSFTRGLIAMDMLVSTPRGKQLVLWTEGPEGVTLIRPLFQQVGSSRTYIDLTRVPRGFTRMFITEEDLPFRGREPAGREVMTVNPPFDP